MSYYDQVTCNNVSAMNQTVFRCDEYIEHPAVELRGIISVFQKLSSTQLNTVTASYRLSRKIFQRDMAPPSENNIIIRQLNPMAVSQQGTVENFRLSFTVQALLAILQVIFGYGALEGMEDRMNPDFM